ncbi:TetR/AcrR family transcriptional regulator [Heliophilum fasciatum]|uniref:TetR family transcriptional regulator n=1 Tax=Heliophilum fasciatum TaxID=35700 RepID=A0A4R2RD57_9FIRM|nr:TetR/AcrR family transcriptional regulator [Heliophilum fasciatum]MCW2279434.1 AcrR family transcriptional regulator [Heliophilum fasciatum]TCP59897.1 TetR family transcriptional regulator [Heliophilum fasciatum]
MENVMSRRDRKKIQVLNTLVDFAMKLFINKGFEETTIADITKSADLGTGTFYNYFHSKEDILKYVLVQKFDHSKNSLEKIEKSTITPQEKIRQILITLAKIYEDNLQLFGLCINHLGLKQPPHGTQFKDILVSIIDEGQKSGDFRKNIPIEMVIETFMGLIKSALSSHSKISFMENLNYKLDLFLGGLTERNK